MTEHPASAPARAVAARTVRILLYSDNGTTRGAVRSAVGEAIGPAAAAVEWTEVATWEVALAQTLAEEHDLLILDAEAGRLGGMGLARFALDEADAPPPVLLLTARPQDAWLATWSGAAATLAFPADPFEIERAVARLLGVDA
jgi:DNA-binding response OmpR family regulator